MVLTITRTGRAPPRCARSSAGGRIGSRARQAGPARYAQGARIVVIRANENEIAEHEHVLALLDKASGGQTVWRRL